MENNQFMKLFVFLLLTFGALFVLPHSVFAANNSDVDQFASGVLPTMIGIASLASVLFLIRGGFLYITSTGKPDEIAHAKQTIRNALIGLVLVIGSGAISLLLQNSFITANTSGATQSIKLAPIQPVAPTEGLTQVLVSAVSGFLQTLIQSATKPIIDGVISFLTMTPSFVTNSVVFNFWLVMVGIVDSLFVLLVAVLGFHFMSASTFGFDEMSLKHLLPRIGLAFLLANISIFLIDGVLALCNTLIQAVLHASGGLTRAWVLNAFDPKVLITDPNGSSLITLIFMVLFIILAITLLLFYISRLITLAVGAVLSPFLFLLWILPGFTDFAIVAARSYLVLIFTVFIHVVIIQLASAFLTLPGQSGTNAIISILIGIATLFTLLKTPGTIMQFSFYNATNGAMRKLGGQIVHVVSSSKPQPTPELTSDTVTRRKTVAL